MAGQIEIILKKSPITRLPKHRATLEALGLRRPGRSVIKQDNPQIRGMIAVVSDMVEVRDVSDGG